MPALVAKPSSARATRESWRRTLERDVQLLRRVEHGQANDLTRFGLAAARLVDSRERDALRNVLARVPHEAIERGAGLAYAVGRGLVMDDRPDDAAAWFVRAQAAVAPEQRLLVSRIGFELGCVYLERGAVATAETILAATEGVLGGRADATADLTHLRALIAEYRGDPELALNLYRRCIRGAADALTSATQVLAIRNLGSFIAHRDPAEAVALCDLGLTMIDAELLAPLLRPSLLNVSCYAMLCHGDIVGARVRGLEATRAARAFRRDRIALLAAFNTAIAYELGGELERAEMTLQAVRDQALTTSCENDIAVWATLRTAWLRFKRGDLGVAATTLVDPRLAAGAPTYADSVETLHAIVWLAGGKYREARESLARLARRYRDRHDDLTAFVVLLWLGYANFVGGRTEAARRAVREACDLGYSRGFRVSPNWWSSAVVETARGFAGPEFRNYAASLVSARGIAEERSSGRRVRVGRDGRILVDSEELPAISWREGRTGSRVLRRFFSALIDVHPAGLTRDELADLLWPNSDGDRAVRNLYAATDDLRRVLTSVPGVRVIVEHGRYAVSLARNAAIE